MAAPPSARTAPLYIGFRTKRYGPRTTSLRGGSKGAGVPLPTTTNVRMHQIAITAPPTATIAPTSSMGPNAAGRTTPDHARTRAGSLEHRRTCRGPLRRRLGHGPVVG